MPMLERTAAGLEPGGLQRLLPRAARAGEKPSRMLHTAFWHHGAPDVGPSTACQDLIAAGSLGDYYLEMFTPNPTTALPLNASSFLLDFLYPKGAVTFMRKLSSSVLDRRQGQATSSGAAAATSQKPSRSYSSFLSASPAADLSQHAKAPLFSTALTDHNFATPSEREDNRVEAPRESWSAATAKEVQPARVEEAALRQMIREDGPFDTDSIERDWIRYNQMEPGPEKAKLGRTMLLFLSRSQSQTDARRISHIFEGIKLRGDDAAIVATAIKAQLALRNRERAMAVFERSMETVDWQPPSAPGFGFLAADALQTSSWDLLARLWTIYQEKTRRSDVDATELNKMTFLPDLSEKLLQFSEYLQGDVHRVVKDAGIAEDEAIVIAPPSAEEIKQDRESLKSLHRALLVASLHRLKLVDAFPCVQKLKSARVYERFIEAAIARKHTNLAARAYSEYRLLPGYRPRHSTLKSMVQDVYYPHNERGMEDVLKDWYSVRGRLSFWAYQKYLAFYAARGDVASVYRLWNEFTEAYPSAIQYGEDTFAHLLKVHAVRGDLAQVEQIFSEIHSKYGVTPNLVCWNIRLHLYVERGDYGTAMRVFEDLCEVVEPDDYSFGTIMALAGGRGDLALVLDLYRLARQCGVRPTEAMVDPIVEAYCQNDRLAEAERLCVKTTREKTVGGRPYTALWNTLLQHHAFRCDLVAIDRTLRLMTRLRVTYDDGTYAALLFALAQCRQPRRAAELLRAAQEDGLFRPAAQHYTLLMMAYIRGHQPHRALQVNRLMHHLGFERSSRQVQLVIKAFSQWQDFPASGAAGQRAHRRELFAKALREFHRSLGPAATQGLGREANRMGLGDVRRYSFVVFMLVQARDFAGVEEVMELYRATIGASPSDDSQGEQQQPVAASAEAAGPPLPLKLCNALILSDYNEGRFDRAKETWRYVLERTKAIARPLALKDTRLPSILVQGRTTAAATVDSSTKPGRLELEEREEGEATEGAQPKVVAKLRYGLSDPLKTMQRVYAAERDAAGLVRLIDDVRASGFLLDNKNWNHYVQNLARLGRTQEAFAVCERELMGQWSGFAVLRARLRPKTPAPTRPETDAEKTAAAASELSDLPLGEDGNTLFAKGGSDSTTDDAEPDMAASSSSFTPLPVAITPVTPATTTSTNTVATARLPRAQQLKESAPRFNRPLTYTLMVLARAYLELERAAPWSSAAERQFQELARSCPRAVHAVRTMVRMNSRLEGRVFGEQRDGLTSDPDLDLDLDSGLGLDLGEAAQDGGKKSQEAVSTGPDTDARRNQDRGDRSKISPSGSSSSSNIFWQRQQPSSRQEASV